VIFSSINDVPLCHLTRDTTVVAKVPSYTGIISNIGIMLWCFTSAIYLFTSTVLRNNGEMHSERVRFLLSAGLFTLFLMLDDAFLFHERIYPTYLGLSNNVVFILYGIISMILISVFKRSIFEVNYILFFMGFGLLAGSVIADKIHDFKLFYLFGIHSSEIKYFIEDSLKFLGIAGWFGFFTVTCLEALSSEKTETENSIH
jgi:hypothetical protein